jgi:hypothetical protein
MRLRTNGRRLLVRQLRKIGVLTSISSLTSHPLFTTLSVDAKDSSGNSTFIDTYFITIQKDLHAKYHVQKDEFFRYLN